MHMRMPTRKTLRQSFILPAMAAAAVSLAAIAPANAGVVGPLSAAKSGAATTTISGMSTDVLKRAFGPSSSEAGVVQEVRWRGRRRGLAIGAGIITLGVLGAIAADRAYGRRYDREDLCYAWRRRCRLGNDRACWKFDSRC